MRPDCGEGVFGKLEFSGVVAGIARTDNIQRELYDGVFVR